MSNDKTLNLHRTKVNSDWIDYNGHMNVAYYVMIGDQATDKFFNFLGMGNQYIKKESRSNFALDMRVVFLRELLEGAPVIVRTQLLDYDTKRLHFLHYIEHEVENYTACLNESVGIHIDMNQREVSCFSPDILRKIESISKSHLEIPRPIQLIRTIGLHET